MSNSSAKQYGGAVPTEMSKSLRPFEGRAASALSTRWPICSKR